MLGKQKMIDYTWQDWENLTCFLGLDFTPLCERAYKNPGSMIRHFLSCKYSTYKEAHDRLVEVLFEMPFDELPTAINEEYKVAQDTTIMVSKAAEWRLLLGK